MPVVEAGCGRRRVLSRQYEAYVRDQRWTMEITEMIREEGCRPGVERDRDYWELGALTTGGIAAHRSQACTHAYTALWLHLSQSGGYTCPASRGCVQSPVLIRLSSSLGGSVCSFVSTIMTGGIRARLLNLFALSSVGR